MDGDGEEEEEDDEEEEEDGCVPLEGDGMTICRLATRLRSLGWLAQLESASSVVLEVRV